MFQVTIKKAKPSITREMFWQLMCALGQKEYVPMTKVMLSSVGLEYNADLLSKYTARASYPTWRYGEQGTSELFFGPDHHVFLVQLQPVEHEEGVEFEGEETKGSLRACCFFDSATTSSAVFDTFITELSAALEEITNAAGKKLSLEWDDIHHVTKTFKRMKEGRERPRLKKAELKAARVLDDGASRELLRNLKKVGSLILSEIEKSIATRKGQPKGLSLAQKLEEARLIQREFVVICKKTGNAVVRADSRDKIESFAAEGLRCTCGRLLSQENIEEAVTPTELGRRLTDHSYWMTVRTLEMLRDFGVPLDDIIMDYTEEGDEIDVFLTLCRRDYIIELKDKEFSLNNSYSFNAKFLRYEADRGMIVTTEVVSPDAKKMLADTISGRIRRRRYSLPSSEEQMQPIVYVEGIEKLRPNIEALVTSVRLELARQNLQRVGSICNLDIAGLVLSRVVPKSV